MSDDFLKEHIKTTSCPICGDTESQLASMGHPMPDINEIGMVVEQEDTRDIWWGGDIVFPEMKTDFNRRCRGCHHLFKV